MTCFVDWFLIILLEKLISVGDSFPAVVHSYENWLGLENIPFNLSVKELEKHFEETEYV